jgi:hypothetical protein
VVCSLLRGRPIKSDKQIALTWSATNKPRKRSACRPIESVAQIVGGTWTLQPDGTVRILETGYDRLIALGDWSTWQDDTMTAEVTIHWVHDPDVSEPSGFDSEVGFGTGRKGHTAVQYGVALPDQPCPAILSLPRPGTTAQVSQGWNFAKTLRTFLRW